MTSPAVPPPLGGRAWPGGGQSRGWLTSRWSSAALAAVVFLVLACLMIGWRSSVSSTRLPSCGCGDLAQSVWFLAWPAYAIRHGLDPLYSALGNAPHGYNLMDATSMPLVGVLMAPVTWLAGPIVAFNVMLRLAIAVSALSMFVLLQRWVRWTPAAFFGGLLYGFCPFMFAQGQSHVFLVVAPLPPLVILLLDNLLARRSGPRRTGALFGLVLAAQLGISPEVLIMELVLVVIGLVVLAVRYRSLVGERAPGLGVALLAAGAVFVVLAAYPLYIYFAGPQHIRGAQHPAATYLVFHDDVAGTVIPTVLQKFGTTAAKMRGNQFVAANDVELQDYLGVPLLLGTVLMLVVLRRSARGLLMAGLALVAFAFALGNRISFDGTVWKGFPVLPTTLSVKLPLLKNVIDTRYMLMVYLCLAVVVALGLDQLWSTRLGAGIRGPRARRLVRTAGCGGLAALMLLPLTPAGAVGSTPIQVPAFFTTSDVSRDIPAGATVLAYPLSDRPVSGAPVFPDVRSLLWQASAGFRFAMIGIYGPAPGPTGRIATPLQQGLMPLAMDELLDYADYGTAAAPAPPGAGGPELVELREFIEDYDVQDVVVQMVGMHPEVAVRYLTIVLGAAPTEVGGILLWQHATALADRAAGA